MTKLPNLDEYPTVMEFDEVSDLLEKIVQAAEDDRVLDLNRVIDLMVGAISALPHRLDKKLDMGVSSRILSWIESNWQRGDEEFADAAATVLLNINISCSELRGCISELLASEKREKVIGYLIECESEIHDAT
ncbi:MULTISPECIES: hypothetical protein [unclassified Thiocapsa]|uniref:hypothetical protein n=1 Tax=unclassified Thiocapsa TaxID=2641286 RepID=UPI0035B20944